MATQHNRISPEEMKKIRKFAGQNPQLGTKELMDHFPNLSRPSAWAVQTEAKLAFAQGITMEEATEKLLKQRAAQSKACHQRRREELKKLKEQRKKSLVQVEARTIHCPHCKKELDDINLILNRLAEFINNL